MVSQQEENFNYFPSKPFLDKSEPSSVFKPETMHRRHCGTSSYSLADRRPHKAQPSADRCAGKAE